MGWPAAAESSRTMAYIWGCWASVTSMAPMERTAILSEFQKPRAVCTRPMTGAITSQMAEPVPRAST